MTLSAQARQHKFNNGIMVGKGDNATASAQMLALAKARIEQCDNSTGKAVGGGTAAMMVCCNGNGGGCATLLMTCCGSNGRGDAALLIGTCYDGKGSGSGAHSMLQRRTTTCRTIAFLLADHRRRNDNQPAMGVDALDVDRHRPGRVRVRGVCDDDDKEKKDGGMLSMS
jgi:hypothetical protein